MRKLTISKDTLRILAGAELEFARGGAIPQYPLTDAPWDCAGTAGGTYCVPCMPHTNGLCTTYVGCPTSARC